MPSALDLDVMAAAVEEIAGQLESVPNTAAMPPDGFAFVDTQSLQATSVDGEFESVLITGNRGLILASCVALCVCIGLAFFLVDRSAGGPWLPMGLAWGSAMAVLLVSTMLMRLDRTRRTETKSLSGQVPVTQALRIPLTHADYPVKRVTVNRAEVSPRVGCVATDAGPSSERLTPAFIGVALSLAGTLVAVLDPQFVADLLWWAALAVFSFTVIGGLAFLRLSWSSRRMVDRNYDLPTAELIEVEVEVAVPEELRPDPDRPERVPAFRIRSLHRGDLLFRVMKSPVGSLLFDESASLGTESFSLPTVETAAALDEIIEQLDREAESIPAVLGTGVGKAIQGDREAPIPFAEPTGLRGQEARLQELLETMAGRMEGLEVETVELPLLGRDHPAVPGLLPLTSNGEEEASPQAPDLARILDGGWIELLTRLRDFRGRWKSNVSVLTAVRFRSLAELLSPALIELGEAVQYGSFNFYCPNCHSQELESVLGRDYGVSAGEDTGPVELSRNSRCCFNQESGTWICEACESSTAAPIPVHKVLDEALIPAYTRLIDENKPSRFELDNRTRDQELSYSNKMNTELDELSREFSHECGRIDREIALIMASMDGNQSAVETLRQLMSEYKGKQNAIVQRIAEQSKGLVREISDATQSALTRRQRDFEDMVRDYDQVMDSLAVAKKKEDMVRDTYLRKTAEGIGRIDQSASLIAGNTGTMVEQNERLHSTMKRVATATEDTANGVQDQTQILNEQSKTLGTLGEKLDRGNAISAAVATKQGVEIHDHSVFRVDKAMKKLHSRAVSGLLGESTVESEQRLGRALE